MRAPDPCRAHDSPLRSGETKANCFGQLSAARWRYTPRYIRGHLFAATVGGSCATRRVTARAHVLLDTALFFCDRKARARNRHRQSPTCKCRTTFELPRLPRGAPVRQVVRRWAFRLDARDPYRSARGTGSYVRTAGAEIQKAELIKAPRCPMTTAPATTRGMLLSPGDRLMTCCRVIDCLVRTCQGSRCCGVLHGVCCFPFLRVSLDAFLFPLSLGALFNLFNRPARRLM